MVQERHELRDVRRHSGGGFWELSFHPHPRGAPRAQGVSIARPVQLYVPQPRGNQVLVFV